MTKLSAIAVFDVGKTHVKLTLLGQDGIKLFQNRTSNRVLQAKPYHHYDVDAIWDWLTRQFKNTSEKYDITDISIATHGAAAALVDLSEGRLRLPVMDYEFDDYPALPTDYKAMRAPFERTGSPELPGGLNLGKQLHWQSHLLTQEQKSRATLLMYPQYWAWRLTGKAVTEVTSLGCHTDLWDVQNGAPTDMLRRIGLETALPRMCRAWNAVGTIKPGLAKELGLPINCRVFPGVHDSNAGYIPYLRYAEDKRPTVISTGTWAIVMDSDAKIQSLNPARDMVVNVNAQGAPLPTARYMGGREFNIICETFDTDIATTFTDADVMTIVDAGALILPSFCKGTGPYPYLEGRVTDHSIQGKAAATLYSALMLDDILETLAPHSTREIAIEGSFANNEVLCRLLAALNPHRVLRTHARGNGVVEGCFLLTQWGALPGVEVNPVVKPYRAKGLENYKMKWQSALSSAIAA